MVAKTIALISVAVAIASADNKQPEVKRFTAFSRPLSLSQGEVTNSFHKLEIPKGPIAVYRFEADVVEKDHVGNVIPTPIYDAYLHHHVVGSAHEAYKHVADKWAPMKPESFSRSVGFGAGTECRGTPQQFYYPYAFVTVPGEDEWIANVHIINTRELNTLKAYQCLECPCTSEDSFTQSAVNGMRFDPHSCNAELRQQNNTVCQSSTYHGGLRCCEDSEFCLEPVDLDTDSPKSTYYLRYTIEYTELRPETRPLYIAGCCDASGDEEHHGNVEYDIPKCDPELHPGCVHTLATRQTVDLGSSSVYAFMRNDTDVPDREVELIFAVGHQHRGGMGISIYNDVTGDLLCSSIPEYGTGHEIGNETGYVVSMSTCTFNPPIRMRASDVLRIISLYNNTVSHTGVMGLMYIAVADVGLDVESVQLYVKPQERVFRNVLGTLPIVVGGMIAALSLIVFIVGRMKKRSDYTPLPHMSYK